MSELYREQSSRWGNIGRKHLETVNSLVGRFVCSALSYVVSDVGVRRSLQVIISEKLERNYCDAKTELERLLADEQFPPITYNHYFTDNIVKSRQQKMRTQIESSMAQAVASDYHGRMRVSNTPDEIDRLSLNLQKWVVVNMEEQACAEALDGLRSYYKVSN